MMQNSFCVGLTNVKQVETPVTTLSLQPITNVKQVETSVTTISLQPLGLFGL